MANAPGPGNTRPRTVVSDKPKESAPPKQTEQELAGRAKTVYGLIDQVHVPLALIAAKDEQEHLELEPDYVSPFTLDIHTIRAHQPVIATEVAKLAGDYPVLAVLLDKWGQAAPFATLLSTAIAIGIQVAENHGALKGNLRDNLPGITPREVLIDQVHEMQDAVRAQGNGAGTTSG